jgi:RNA 2',3'-cyclic 3'-phosphodiesterase
MESAAQSNRLFIAISLPEAVKAKLLRVQDEMKKALPRGCVRWTKPEQFHLTLKFLGLVKADEVEALSNSLSEVCASFPALRLRAERVGFFPDLRYPRVIWAWVHDAKEQLPVLQSAIEQAVGSFSEEKAEKTFTGHITLGRCQGIKRPQAEILSRLALGMTERFFGEWTAEAVELIRSELSPSGSHYTTLAAIALANESSFGTLPPT